MRYDDAGSGGHFDGLPNVIATFDEGPEMRRLNRRSLLGFGFACGLTCASGVFLAPASAETSGLKAAPLTLLSTGPMAFTDDGVLIVGDPKQATVFAVDLGMKSEAAEVKDAEIGDLRAAIAKATGGSADEVTVGDLAVDAASGLTIVSASVGDRVHLIRVGAGGDLTDISMDRVSHAAKPLPNPPEDKIVGQGRRQKNLRMESITDVAFFDGKVMVSGVSAGDSPSSVLEFPYPFAENTIVTNVQIYHAAHDRVEEPAIRAFVPMMIDGEPTLLAGFTCTPLVRFPIDQLGGQGTVRGTTVAELGNRNTPIDLIAYEKDGQSSLLMSNTARGVMKISTQDIQNAPGLTERVSGGGTAGQAFETIESLSDVTQMAKLGESHAVVIIGKSDTQQRLGVVELP